MPADTTYATTTTDDIDATSFYRALGEGRYEPTIHTQGAWREDEQHMGAPAGLIAHCLERHQPREDLMLSRICYDILGVIDLATTEVRIETIRPGRTIELLEATVTTGDSPRPAIRARAWRLQTSDTSEVAGGGPDPLPDQDDPSRAPSWREQSEVWPGGFIRALDIRRPDRPGLHVPGRGVVWQRTDIALVDTEDSTDTARFLLHADTANGMSVREDPHAWAFPNVDLTVHLHRRPTYAWVGIASDVTFGANGVGTTSATLYDADGPVARTEQSLTIRRSL
ncbi:MAG: thioesterase family protein [Actinomycetia bacterium]|nr:thioesterase family protein [Actinomycetes bacterium]